MRIPLVEGGERISSFMKRGLEAEGYWVDLAQDGDEGLEKGRSIFDAIVAEEYEVDLASDKVQPPALTQSRSYHVIVLDIFLGADDGLDLCRSLRRHSVSAPILHESQGFERCQGQARRWLLRHTCRSRFRSRTSWR